ncbi:MAG: hypothetical protein H9W81_13660 [Enterococcus sp.]|nr:hypothetical protein [Enterococcus sp.]
MSILTNDPGTGLGMASSLLLASAGMNGVTAYLAAIPYRKYDTYGKKAMKKIGEELGYNFLSITPKNRQIAKLIRASRQLGEGQYYALPVSAITDDKNSPYTLVLLRDNILLQKNTTTKTSATPEISEKQWQAMYESLTVKELDSE